MSLFTASLIASPLQEVRSHILTDADVQLFIKREDLLHPQVSGNKFRKLKYNILEAQAKGEPQLLTFGGAYSNHIAATAAAGNLCGLRTIGIIRGEELGSDLDNTLRTNDTLRFAKEQGMHLHFITRAHYQEKTSDSFLRKLALQFGAFYHIPEGGTNDLAIKGCQEILSVEDKTYDYICCAVGTGGTIAGIIEASETNQQILGFPALKGNFLRKEIEKFTRKTNFELIGTYHFGGYGKVNRELIAFMNAFKDTHQIMLDPIYTGKMMYGLYDLMKSGYFPKKSRILAVHTGGLQGILGINAQLRRKQLPLINYDAN